MPQYDCEEIYSHEEILLGSIARGQNRNQLEGIVSKEVEIHWHISFSSVEQVEFIGCIQKQIISGLRKTLHRHRRA